MNIIALRTLLAVIQSGNLNKAAEQLNVTQSTVTTRLDSLEAALGQKLLLRSRRGAQLTKAGFALQRHAELIVQAWEQARKSVILPKGFSGRFSFACQSELWEGAGSAWLEQVQRDHPGLALEAWPGEASEIKRWLSSGLSDAALALEPLSGPGQTACILAHERLVQVSTGERPDPQMPSNYIYVDLGADFRRQHSRAWPSGEAAHMTFGSSNWALDYLLRKGGSAYLPWRLAGPHLAAGTLDLVADAPEFTRAIHLTWRDASLSEHPWINRVPLPHT